MKARLDTLKLHLSYGPELNLWLPYFKNTKLKHLYLDGNEQLDLSGNKLLEVPSGVKFLKKLENLNLSYQNTAARKFQLKDVLRNLTSLRVLNMTRTPLFEISS
ncbi:hypothetical protein B566_EDAN013133 [Ephemera danica]|nr:hypothetical protein B566_EDAN013133 [Ephemera danica]